MMYVLLATSAAFLVSAATAILADYLLSERIPIMGSQVGFERTENAGIAFGIDLPGWLLSILIPAALLLIGRLAWKSRHQRIPSIGFGLILGGALGNILDRFDDGFVTDFIQVGWWPVFNVADSCITVGIALLLLFEWKNTKMRKYENA
jgi:signal peptidase II